MATYVDKGKLTETLGGFYDTCSKQEEKCQRETDWSTAFEYKIRKKAYLDIIRKLNEGEFDVEVDVKPKVMVGDVRRGSDGVSYAITCFTNDGDGVVVLDQHNYAHVFSKESVFADELLYNAGDVDNAVDYLDRFCTQELKINEV